MDTELQVTERVSCSTQKHMFGSPFDTNRYQKPSNARKGQASGRTCKLAKTEESRQEQPQINEFTEPNRNTLSRNRAKEMADCIVQQHPAPFLAFVLSLAPTFWLTALLVNQLLAPFVDYVMFK